MVGSPSLEMFKQRVDSHLSEMFVLDSGTENRLIVGTYIHLLRKLEEL